MAGRVHQFVARAAHLLAVEPGRERLVSSCRARPQRVQAGLLRWNPLDVGKCFAILVRSDRRERLIVVLGASIGAEGHCACRERLPVRAHRELAKTSVIVLIGRAVLACVFEYRTAGEHASAVRNQTLQR